MLSFIFENHEDRIGSVFIICCNDSIMVALQSKIQAERLLRRLAAREWIYGRQNFRFKTYEDYRSVFYWHIHEVPLIRKE